MARTEQDKYVTPGSSFVPTDSPVITPNDGADLPRPIRAIRATTGGVIKVVTGSGDTRTIAIEDGETRWLYITKVFATDTTADGLEGLI